MRQQISLLRLSFFCFYMTVESKQSHGSIGISGFGFGVKAMPAGDVGVLPGLEAVILGCQ